MKIFQNLKHKQEANRKSSTLRHADNTQNPKTCFGDFLPVYSFINPPPPVFTSYIRLSDSYTSIITQILAVHFTLSTADLIVVHTDKVPALLQLMF